MGTLSGADAGEGSGHTVFGVATHHLHQRHAAVGFCVQREHAQGRGVGGVQCDFKLDGVVYLHALGHGEGRADIGVPQQKCIGLCTHAALGKGGKIFFGFPHTGGQGKGKVHLAPVVRRDSGQCRRFGGGIDTALVPGGDRQAVHV